MRQLQVALDVVICRHCICDHVIIDVVADDVDNQLCLVICCHVSILPPRSLETQGHRRLIETIFRSGYASIPLCTLTRLTTREGRFSGSENRADLAARRRSAGEVAGRVRLARERSEVGSERDAARVARDGSRGDEFVCHIHILPRPSPKSKEHS